MNATLPPNINEVVDKIWETNRQILAPMFPTPTTEVDAKKATGSADWGSSPTVSFRTIACAALATMGIDALQELPVVRTNPYGVLLKLPDIAPPKEPESVVVVDPIVPAHFTTIVADPPWLYTNQKARGAVGDKYDKLPWQAVEAMPVGAIAAENAHLYLWVTNWILAAGIGGQVVQSWGFVAKTILTWRKNTMGVGNYFRNDTEHMIFAVKGKLRTNPPHNVRTQFFGINKGHSRKPAEAHKIISVKSPGPIVELFARNEPTEFSQDWYRWGRELYGGISLPRLEKYFDALKAA